MDGTHRFRRDIQGLRALAVLPVVIFHAFPDRLPGGFVGVDIFFVISGYLITRILHAELREDRFSIASFYVRRVKRLFPALYLMLLATMLLGLVMLPPAELRELAKTVVATVGFFANFLFYTLSGYFDGQSELKPLLHTWSLAVEEQFYLVFPLALTAAYRLRPRWLPALLRMAAALSLAWSIYELGQDPSRAFYYPWPRAFELLIGAIVAVGAVPKVGHPAVRDGLSLLGIVLIVGSLLMLSDEQPFPGLAALPPCIGAALVLAMGEHGESLGGRMLGAAPLVVVGSLSYSLYLWHWPALVFGRYIVLRPLTAPEAAAAVVVAFALAWLSWRYVERPVLKWRMAHRPVLIGGAAIMAATTALAMAVVLTKGLPQRIDPVGRTFVAAAGDSSPFRTACHSGEHDVIPYARLCRFGDRRAVPDTLVWGDSFGAELVVALGEKLAPERRSVLQITASGCPPALGYTPRDRPGCAAYNAARLAQLTDDPRIREVVLVVNYLGFMADTPDQQHSLLAGIERTAQALHAQGKGLSLVYPIPRMPFVAPTALAMQQLRGGDPGRFGQQRDDFDRGASPVSTWLDRIARETGARRIVPAQRLCGPRLCPAYMPGAGVLYFDHAHLSLAGARHLFAGARI
ncbi:MAG: acyltransferase family protein [Pseudomonadota bacterium]